MPSPQAIPAPRECPYCREGSFYRIVEWRDGFRGFPVWVDGLTGLRHSCAGAGASYQSHLDKVQPFSAHPADQPKRDARRIALLEQQLASSYALAGESFAASQKDAALLFAKRQKDRETVFKDKQEISLRDAKLKVSALHDRLDEEATMREAKAAKIVAENTQQVQALLASIHDVEAGVSRSRAGRTFLGSDPGLPLDD